MLESTTRPLYDAYDLAMLDLDGVVYVGDAAVPGARVAIEAVRANAMHLAFITNNASRPPSAVAEHLRELGIDALETDVVTSAQAAARVVRDIVGQGASVVCLGTVGLREALEAEGLVPVGADEEAEALVSGYAPDIAWREVMRAAVRIRDGLRWVASNTDYTIPTPFGTAPGHGVLVEMLQRFTGVEPEVAGKPARPLLDETIRRVGGARPLMVGDRLDTDIAGARAAGLPSMLVLTGVTGLAQLVAAAPGERPTYIAEDLGGLLEAHPGPESIDERSPVARLGGWTARVVDGRAEVTGSGAAADWWRVVATAAWRYRDQVGEIAGVAGLSVPPPVGR